MNDSYEQYRAIPAVNWSTLKELRKSPLHYQHILAEPRKDTPALQLGRAVHTAIFEPHRFATSFAVRPEGIDRRTTAGKTAYAQFETANAGRTILATDDHSIAWEIGKKVREHPVSAPYFRENGQAEFTLQWQDPQTGIPCKARLDWMIGGFLLDLKTARQISYREFQMQAWKLGYFHQLAFYSFGWVANYQTAPQVRIVAVESDKPHDVAVFVPDSDSMFVAEREVMELLVQLADCRRHDQWPGQYPIKKELSAPAYALDWDDDD